MPASIPQPERTIPRLAVAAVLACLAHGVALPVAMGWNADKHIGLDDPLALPETQPSPEPEPSAEQPVDEPAADLAVTEPRVPSRLVLGGEARLRFTVANLGEIAAALRPDVNASWWSDAVYLSDDASLDADDVLIAESDALGRLSRGGSYEANLNAVLPADAEAGPAYLLLVTDHDDVVDEAGRESNNVLAAPVDLRPVAETPTNPVLGDATAAPRLTVAWISHEAFEELQAGPDASETIQPALQSAATPVPDAPLRAGNAQPSPMMPSPTAAASTANTSTQATPPLQVPPAAARDPFETPSGEGEPVLADASNEPNPTEADITEDNDSEEPTESIEAQTSDSVSEPTAPSVASASTAPSAPVRTATPEEPRPSSAPQGATDSDLADLKPVPVFRAGKVEVAEGLTVTPSRPDFSVPAIVASVPRNPRVRITFDTDGAVLDAALIDTAGSDMLDAPIRASLYRWRSSGEKLATWEGPREFTFTILLTRTRSPTP
ncbi:MAG: CARDB domain-containing protein [Planctomycetota bacterium]